MEPVSVVQLASATASLAKTVFDSVTLARKKVKGDKDAEEALATVSQLVLELQTHTLSLQAEAFNLSEKYGRLHQEHMQLREEIRKEEERATGRERYEIRQVGQSAVVVDKERPDVYLCATCFEAGSKVYLSKLPRVAAKYAGTHTCPKCKGNVWAP